MKLGLMQGRLSNPVEGFQECPLNWSREFDLLLPLGLTHIDWVVTSDPSYINPLYYRNLTPYPVHSICADNLIHENFMDYDFLEKNLNPLCILATRNKINHVTIPLLEKSSIVDPFSRREFKKNISKYGARYPMINFSFEAECAADVLSEIISLFNNFYVTYDTGNMTSCKINHQNYIKRMSNKIDNVHLKDRTHKGETKSPGLGDTEFDIIFKTLKEIGYTNTYTLQTAREISGAEFDTIKKHINFFKELYHAN